MSYNYKNQKIIIDQYIRVANIRLNLFLFSILLSSFSIIIRVRV